MQGEAVLIGGVCKGRQLIHDQKLTVLGADILTDPRNNYYGRSSNKQRIQLSPKQQSFEFRCSREVESCNSINLVVHVCKQWPMKRHVSR